jgi:hypothetical protein
MNDLLKLKGYKPFKSMRQNGKTVGLATLFAAQGPTLGRQLKSAGWNENDCDHALENFGLINAYNTALNSPNNRYSATELKYVIIGGKLRELFFQTYPSLIERVEREQAFAKKHGYVRTWVGPVRHLHELRLYTKNAQGNLIGMDKKLYSKIFANLKNIASNTSIQTAEVAHAMPDIACIHENLKRWGFRSRIFNYVHDSIDFYVYKPERDIVYALCNEVARICREPYFGIPMEIDITECDLAKGQYYKSGDEINIRKFSLDEELAKWNAKHGTNLVFDWESTITGGFYEGKQL